MEEEQARGRVFPGEPGELKTKKEDQDRTASDNSSEGLPPGREELVAHAQLKGSAGQLGSDPTSSTPPDEFIEDMDVPLESSSNSACEPERTKGGQADNVGALFESSSDSRCETKMKGEEQATSGAGSGVP